MQHSFESQKQQPEEDFIFMLVSALPTDSNSSYLTLLVQVFHVI